MDFRVLGSVGIADGDTLLPLGGGIPRRLLGALLAHRNAVVSADRLVEILWSDPPGSAAATLQSYVSRLRRFIDLAGEGAALVGRAPGYVLELPEGLVDAGRFEQGLADGRDQLERDPATARERLDAALAEWRGDAFAEFADAEWIRPEAVRLEELRVVACEVLVDAELRLGHHAEVVGRLESLRVEHPLREQFTRQLVLALHRAGRQPEALRVAQEFRSLLRDELGLEPSVELRTLERAVLEEAPELDWEPPAARTAVRRTHHGGVPAETTTLVGRADDLELAATLLASARIFTLLGAGGVGKTRLASRLAASAANGFADGVRYVELAPLRDDSAVIAAIADALDVQQRPQRSLTDSIVELLDAQAMLLVLDNCEHVLDATSDVVEAIVKWCPGVKILATSREPLGVRGEVVWSVPPLPVPDPDDPLPLVAASPSVALFVERAQAARADFRLDDTTRDAVVEIAIRLDGVPLALELAAARMRSMSAAQLAERLPERFRVLTGSRRAAEARHRTLRDLVQWSYELLTPTEQRLFDRLSVFASAFSLDRAELVCAGDGIEAGDVAGLLGALVDKSMLVADSSSTVTSYRLLETLREFGRDRLQASPDHDAVRDRHAAVHADVAARASVGLGGADEAEWMATLDAAFDDMREVHAAAVAAGDVDRALGVVVHLREYAWRQIRYELLSWTDAAVALPGAEEHPRFPTAVAMVAYGRFVRGELLEAIACGEAAAAAADRLGASSSGLAERSLANALFYCQRESEAIDWMDRMVDEATRTGDPSALAHALYMRSVAATSIGDADAGETLAASAARAARESRSPTALAQADYARAVACAARDPERALTLLDRSVARAESVDNRWIRAFALTESLWIRAQRGDRLGALAGYRDVIDAWFRGGDWANQWLTLRHVVTILETLGRDEVAATLFGALSASGVVQALPIEPGAADALSRAVDRLRARLGEAAFCDAMEQGQELRDEEVVRGALAACTVGDPHR